MQQQAPSTMSSLNEHFIIRIGDGSHFNSSSQMSIWGIDSSTSASKGFLSKVKSGDILWFATSGSNGKLVAVATFTGTKERILGPLISLTPTNEELGWTKKDGKWDTEVHYKDLYNLTHCNIFSEIKGNANIRLYNDKCKVNLPAEYPRIVSYSNATKQSPSPSVPPPRTLF